MIFSRRGHTAMTRAYDEARQDDAAREAEASRQDGADREDEAARMETRPGERAAMPTASLFLPERTYADNPLCLVSQRFLTLRKKNPDIVGYLEIPGMLEEIVVQRDNEFYLRRDAYGYHNVNGAIFLDAGCDLKKCPYTLILYGHNMRTGDMFGALRNYENEGFYHSNPFITFGTLYETGEYVIFAVADVSVNEKSMRYVDLDRLQSRTLSWRQGALTKLKNLSSHINRVPVQADDQLLLLVTCVGDGDDRRIVAARKLRQGETREDLLRLLNR